MRQDLLGLTFSTLRELHKRTTSAFHVAGIPNNVAGSLCRLVSVQAMNARTPYLES